MADTRAHGAAERWVVEHDLPKSLGQAFVKRCVSLTWGGSFEFDAVSEDGQTIVCVSTSCCRTATGRQAVGKFHKIKADALYLLGAQGVSRRVLVFTDAGMLAHFANERQRGRFPDGSAIELRHVSLPAEIEKQLRAATAIASSEVSPMTTAVRPNGQSRGV